MGSFSEMLRAARRRAARRAVSAVVEKAAERTLARVEELKEAVRPLVATGNPPEPEVSEAAGVEERRRRRAERTAAAAVEVDRLKEEAHAESRKLHPTDRD